MNTKLILKKFIVTAALLILSGAAIAVAMDKVADGTKTYSWRYKLTVEVETPEGVRTGSAVREVTVTFTPRYKPDPRDPQYNIDKSLKGEAVVVDLGERGKVFAALNSSISANMPFYHFDGPPGLTIEGAEYYSKLKDVSANVKLEYYPPLITFTDLSDPLSIQLLLEKEQVHVVPNEYVIKADHFEENFGHGVKLRGISIEMTDEPVTKGILSVLTWIPNFFDQGRLDGSRFGHADAENRLANKFSSGSFTTFREY